NNLANDGIDIEIRPGEIHALLGENGAGKTTLMNILYGLIQPDSGEINIHGQPAHFSTPRDAIRSGVGMVHQQFMLVPNLTVVENVTLGLGTPGGIFFEKKEPIRRIENLVHTYGLKVNPNAEISHLSVGEQQRVEIIKALYRNVDILIMDEPTSVLTSQETDHLFKVLSSFTAAGHTVIFISHKLNEVLSISQRITVLRDGHLVGTINTSGSSSRQLARMMVGREISLDMDRVSHNIGESVLELQGVWADNDSGLPALKNVSFTVHRGEIFGIAGVDGNGQREMTEMLRGLRPIKRGIIKLNGIRRTNYTPNQAINMGIGLIPEDRRGAGMLTDLPVWQNILLGAHTKPPYVRQGFLQISLIQEKVKQLLNEFDVRPSDPKWIAGRLSGGNQQKIVLAREIDRKPQLLIASQPTRGLDIQTTEYIRSRLIQERDHGAAILLVSTDLQEILALCDRIAVIYEGKIMDIITSKEANNEQIGLLMAGVDKVEQETIPGA
ncbi:MAG: ABC transporter ATP-binding protein, partial [Anaerolineaceae bacterium]